MGEGDVGKIRELTAAAVQDPEVAALHLDELAADRGSVDGAVGLCVIAQFMFDVGKIRRMLEAALKEN